MNTRICIWTAIVSVALIGGCAAEPSQPIEQDQPKSTPVDQTDLPSLPDAHPDVSQLALLSRGPRRLSVDQIERSIETIGALPAGSVVIPPSLAQTLGEPDYFRVTEEGLEPTPLFMKFMMDLAGFICFGLSDLDPDRPTEERVLTRYSDIDENIRYILLRFTGIEGEAADEYVPRLRASYETGLGSSTRANGGWEAVCFSVFTSPEFLLY